MFDNINGKNHVKLRHLSENDANIITTKENDNLESFFSNVNMIPRTIEDIIRKEKTSFGYLNKNLSLILFTLFFNSLLKENLVGYCSYYFYYKITFDPEKDYIDHKYLSLFISV